MEPICAVVDVTHRYGGVTALADLSCSVPTGSLTGLIGSNGSGKSTLMRIMTGTMRPTAGHVATSGTTLVPGATLPPGVGALVDGVDLWPGWTARRTLNYLSDLAGLTSRDAETVIQDVGIAEPERAFKDLSLGNRQKVGLAAALLTATDFLLLDEPMNGLDPPSREEIRRLLRRRQAAGLSILLSSHDLREVGSICTHILHLHDGTIRFQGTVEQFRSRHQVHTFRLPPSETGTGGRALSSSGIAHRVEADQLVVPLKLAASARETLQRAQIQIASEHTRAASVEESFHVTS